MEISNFSIFSHYIPEFLFNWIYLSLSSKAIISLLVLMSSDLSSIVLLFFTYLFAFEEELLLKWFWLFSKLWCLEFIIFFKSFICVCKSSTVIIYYSSFFLHFYSSYFIFSLSCFSCGSVILHVFIFSIYDYSPDSLTDFCSSSVDKFLFNTSKAITFCSN